MVKSLLASVWSRGTRTLTSAFGVVLGAWLAAAPPASAQSAEQEFACFVYTIMLDVGIEQCEQLGCDPSEKDCEKFCKTAERSCKSSGKLQIKLFEDDTQSQEKAAKVLCKTADDPKGCKQAAKAVGAFLDAEDKVARIEIKAACKDPTLAEDCRAACMNDLVGFSCDAESVDP